MRLTSVEDGQELLGTSQWRSSQHRPWAKTETLDVHTAQVTSPCALRTRRGRGWRIWRSSVAGLLALVDWLKSYGVTHVAVEATGVYWLPVWHNLEDDFELTLCNARQVKYVLAQPRPARTQSV
jgi:hypothetical protein